MKIILNFSTIVIGGGIQASISFLEELILYKDYDFHIFLSNQVSQQINFKSNQSNFKFYNIYNSPSKIRTRFKVLKQLKTLEKKIKPNLVFTMFGPSYWKPDSIHLCGFADGWCYNPKSIAFKKLNLYNKLRTFFLIKYKNYKLINDSDFIVVETDLARKNINKFLKLDLNKIFVIGNSYSTFFNKRFKNIERKLNKSEFRLLTVSSFYKHKNLEIINDVSKKLKIKSKNSFKFYLTIDNYNYDKFFKNNDSVINLGPQYARDCPGLYQRCDAMFLPTLLETFSASYPEAMKMNIPILTSDLDFARELCGSAASYFDPTNPEDISEKILELSNDKSFYNSLIERGKRRLKDLESPKSKAVKYIDLINKIYLLKK
tara:strand:- start:519 stop:1640 length:1122 start_codon:yes stop_codon:yes gene_type:complete